MPTIIAHALVPLAIGVATGRQVLPQRVVAAGMVLAIMPDTDVIGFKLGIAYAADWGHRGASHSLLIAAIMAGLATLAVHRRWRSFAFLFGAAASHGLLDMATDGGLGVALYWPIETMRHFWEFRPIRVSPIGLHALFSPRGMETILSELRWIALPSAVLAIGGLLFRRAIYSPSARQQNTSSSGFLK